MFFSVISTMPGGEVSVVGLKYTFPDSTCNVLTGGPVGSLKLLDESSSPHTRTHPRRARSARRAVHRWSSSISCRRCSTGMRARGPGARARVDVEVVAPAGTVVGVGLWVPGSGVPPGAPTTIVGFHPGLAVARDRAEHRVRLALLEIDLRRVLARRAPGAGSRAPRCSSNTRVCVPPLSMYLIRLTPAGTLNDFAWKLSSGSASISRVLIAGPVGCDVPGRRLGLRQARAEHQ